jgi:hypothetical protein
MEGPSTVGRSSYLRIKASVPAVCDTARLIEPIYDLLRQEVSGRIGSGRADENPSWGGRFDSVRHIACGLLDVPSDIPDQSGWNGHDIGKSATQISRSGQTIVISKDGKGVAQTSVQEDHSFQVTLPSGSYVFTVGGL